MILCDFCDFKGFGGSINQAAVLEFVDSGRDLILALDANASDLIREIAVECGVDFDDVCVFLSLIQIWYCEFRLFDKKTTVRARLLICSCIQCYTAQMPLSLPVVASS